MKANELMVGDWVKIKTYGVSDKFERTEAYIYVKIAEIGSGFITVEHNNDIKESYRICENTEIEPIPLTPKILEKNGFVPKWRDNSLVEYLIYKDIVDGLHEMYIKITFFVGQDEHILDCFYVKTGGFHVWIKYVHQLQHALRLCEIEKEMIL